MSIKEAFNKLDTTTKERMALEATLRGVDLEIVFNSIDHLADLIGPLYRKNLAALGADQPAATNAPEEKEIEITKEEMAAARDGDWRTEICRCPECGAHTTSFVDNMCHPCWDDRHGGHAHE
jgi:phage terminase large subunit GpA-like protein